MSRWEPPMDRKEIVGRKSHYFVERWGIGWAVTVKRFGKSPETVLCDTPGEVNRLRMKLTNEGLVGHIGGDA